MGTAVDAGIPEKQEGEGRLPRYVATRPQCDM